MTKISDKVTKEMKFMYLMGDYNINLLNVDSDAPTSQFINNMYIHSLIPLITWPTRITKHSATLIDNIYTNNLTNNNRQTQGILVRHFRSFTCLSHILLKDYSQQKEYSHSKNISPTKTGIIF